MSESPSPIPLPAGLPPPPAEAVAVHQRLLARIGEEIRAGGGALPFARFMELALYAPGLGYYSNGLAKFGPDGDFITAPEVSELFGRCLARTGEPLLQALPGAEVLEFGAGSGRLAADLLATWAELGCLPERYAILERSGALRAVQRETLVARVPALLPRVEWLEALPAEGLRGFLLGNEVLDAFPVHRFRWQEGQVWEWCVTESEEGLGAIWQLTANVRLQEVVTRLAGELDLAEGYQGELSLQLGPWVAAVAECLREGAMLFIDYGYPRRELYHPQRSDGTLVCHYRHRMHGDALALAGLQDITSYVDFTTVAEAGVGQGLQLMGFTAQAQFLVDCGIEQWLAELPPDGSARQLQRVNEAKRLLMPGEMGERFRCIGFGRGWDQALPGFRLQDLRGRL